MPVQITARRDGFRRLGIVHSARTVTYPDERFTKSEIAILKNDPNLIVAEVANIADTESMEEQLKAALNEIIELKDKLIDINAEKFELKGQLDVSLAQLDSVTAERDQLLAAQLSPAPSELTSAEPEKSEKKKG
ncbi:HI1506-related protein [Citrobacter meridianamericanus]|uniref:HI1506-related protein n=1 Tax=Citrobacter meridianamericanus TaxID=2894201 RepID=UPI00351D8614